MEVARIGCQDFFWGEGGSLMPLARACIFYLGGERRERKGKGCCVYYRKPLPSPPTDLAPPCCAMLRRQPTRYHDLIVAISSEILPSIIVYVAIFRLGRDAPVAGGGLGTGSLASPPGRRVGVSRGGSVVSGGADDDNESLSSVQERQPILWAVGRSRSSQFRGVR